MESPSPFPLILLVTKGSKIFSFNSSGIPMPLSSIKTFIGKFPCWYLVEIFIIPLISLIASTPFFNRLTND